MVLLSLLLNDPHLVDGDEHELNEGFEDREVLAVLSQERFLVSRLLKLLLQTQEVLQRLSGKWCLCISDTVDARVSGQLVEGANIEHGVLLLQVQGDHHQIVESPP